MEIEVSVCCSRKDLLRRDERVEAPTPYATKRVSIYYGDRKTYCALYYLSHSEASQPQDLAPPCPLSVNTSLEPSKNNIATISFFPIALPPVPILNPRVQSLSKAIMVRDISKTTEPPCAISVKFLDLLTFNHSRHHHPPRLFPPLQALGAQPHGRPPLQAA